MATYWVSIQDVSGGNLGRGLLYLISALVLGLIFLAYVIALFVSYSDALAKKTFRFSITYLSLLFAALLIDHYFI